MTIFNKASLLYCTVSVCVDRERGRRKGMMSCFGGFSRSVGVMCYLESVNGRDERDGAERGKETKKKRQAHTPTPLMEDEGAAY